MENLNMKILSLANIVNKGKAVFKPSDFESLNANEQFAISLSEAQLVSQGEVVVTSELKPQYLLGAKTLLARLQSCSPVDSSDKQEYIKAFKMYLAKLENHIKQ